MCLANGSRENIRSAIAPPCLNKDINEFYKIEVRYTLKRKNRFFLFKK